METDNRLEPGRQRRGREDEARCVLFSGPWHRAPACSSHTCVHGAIQDIITYPAGLLKSGQEKLTQGKRCDSLIAVLTQRLGELWKSLE